MNSLELDKIKDIVGKCCSILKRNYDFCELEDLTYVQKDIDYFHIEIIWRLNLPRDFLSLFADGSMKVYPHIGLDLNLTNDEGCFRTISHVFHSLDTSLGNVAQHYQHYLQPIVGVT